ncbi:MAG TPA: glycerol-3-phosphate acyltransferase [Planctomycetota bacterium]|nr:glycerol-3-phosphate acyltransferase [Planctomycetota bacterium]
MALGCASLLSFLLGAIPFALLVVYLCKRVDVRTIGSGNVGATNASRAFTTRGGRLAAFVMIYVLDAGKGFLAAELCPRLLTDPGPLLVAVVCGGAAVCGHVFSPFLRFRGGKGVATATGVLLALDWQAAGLAVLVFFVVRLLTGHVFFGSLALGLALAVAAILLHPGTAFGERLPLTVLCLVLAVLLFWTHRGNLKRHFAARAAGNA